MTWLPNNWLSAWLMRLFWKISSEVAKTRPEPTWQPAAAPTPAVSSTIGKPGAPIVGMLATLAVKYTPVTFAVVSCG